jgi:hypothetical protein
MPTTIGLYSCDSVVVNKIIAIGALSSGYYLIQREKLKDKKE